MKKSQNLSLVSGPIPVLDPVLPSESGASPGTPEGGRRPTEGVPGDDYLSGQHTNNTEVQANPTRRHFSASHKLRVLEEADRCHAHGDLGALLRREGIYHATLIQWRKQRQEGTLSGLSPRKRGRKEKFLDPATVKKLIAENERLKKRLEQAELIIELQKKISSILGIQNNEEN